MQNINEKKVEKNVKTNLTSSFLEIKKTDKDVFDAIFNENERQENQIELIASENFTSKAVMEAQGSVFTNKYAEGYAGRRYYGGCENADIVERLAISRLKELFGCKFANVQPHSGCSANLAILYALMQPNDTLLGMDLNAGGHLTHGYGKTISGSWMNSVSYGVKDSDGTIDYNEVEELAVKHKPKVIVAGFSAYSRIIDWSKFREIADKVGAILWVDMAHIAGLVAAGAYPSPVPFADVVSSTTHKTLRGPRGAFILSNTSEMAKKINSAIFPGCQGGPLMHVIAAKAIAFKEALQPEFTTYINQVVKNAKALAGVLEENNIDIVSGGTDCHMFTADLRKLNINGSDACDALEAAGMTCNKNAIPNDPLPPSQTSGIRLGAPAATTRGFKEAEFKIIGENIVSVLRALSSHGAESEELKLAIDKCKVANKKLCEGFPLYAVEA